MSNYEEESQLPSSRQSHSIGQLARIEVEQPSRRMRLMFGEQQVVYIRSDGLRSRVVRENLKKRKEDSAEVQKKEPDSSTLDEVIDLVAQGNFEESSLTCPAQDSKSNLEVSDMYTASSSTSHNGNHSKFAEKFEHSSEVPGAVAETKRRRKSAFGNRGYNPPTQYHGESTMVPHKNRWTYQTACNINAAEQSDDSQMYYKANPFYPMPRERRNEISTAARMNYAGQRLDNRKFRSQANVVNQVGATANERVTCEKCGMRYFYESKRMQERISYLPAVNEEELPTVLFDCPVCKVQTRVLS